MDNNTNARKIYGDIIDLPHHQSETRTHMPLNERAAQFAPFAALSGFDEIIREESRYTDNEKELEEHERESIDRELGLIAQKLQEGKHPAVALTLFRPDIRKDGGSYVTIHGKVKKIDDLSGMIELFGDAEGPEKLRETIGIDIGSLVAVKPEEDTRF